MRKHIIYCVVTMTAFFSSCSDFGSTNVSPNASAVPLTSALLTNALTALGGYTTATLPGLYCQYWTETLYTDASRYSIQDVNWTQLNGSLYDLQNIININTDEATKAYAALQGSNNNQIAMARILKAYMFSVLTDRYGDMPYTEALQQKTQPKFDTQESIYTDIFKELAEAVAQFDDGPTVKGDILFGGDTAKWKMFANSWKLILAMRMSNVNEAMGKTAFADALAADGGIMTTLEDTVSINYPGNSVAFSNPWFGTGGDFNVSETLADVVNGLADNRIDAFGKPAGGELVGFPYGLARQDAIAWAGNNAGTLILNDKWRKANSTLHILATADVLLVQAEAAERGWIPGGATAADAFYADGIQASWEQWGVFDQNDFDAYMGLADVELGTLDRSQKIGTQRWLAFYPNGQQGWSEWRRTGFPVLAPSPKPVTPGQGIPVRYIFPTVEYGLNGASVADAASKLDDGDTMNSHVWWDK